MPVAEKTARTNTAPVHFKQRSARDDSPAGVTLKPVMRLPTKDKVVFPFVPDEKCPLWLVASLKVPIKSLGTNQ